VSAVSFSDVTLGHGRHLTLIDASFVIEQGQFVGLLGANGSGKTTLLRAILGLQPVRSGSIGIFGSLALSGNRRIGYVPQFRKALTEVGISGRDLLLGAAAGTRFGWPFDTAADRRDVDRVLELTKASALARQPLGLLSGGERQRILIAQALLGAPTMLLLDEPLVSLDPNHQTAVVGLVRDIQQQFGMTVIFSSHELTPLLGQIDSILYLGQKTAALGSVDDVITAESLSRLYGAPMDVVRSRGRIFVVAGAAGPT
jgi:zinc/manganese transport system ATP-binding protein